MLGECKECGWQKWPGWLALPKWHLLLLLSQVESWAAWTTGGPSKAFNRVSCLTILENSRETLLPLLHLPSTQAAERMGQSLSVAEVI